MLTIDDFSNDAMAIDSPNHPLRDTYALYQIEAAKSALILRDIVYIRWLPRRMEGCSDILHESLRTWKQGIPALLDWTSLSCKDNPLALSLSILHDHHLILADLGHPPMDIDAGESVVHSAAQRISAAGSSIVVRSQALQVPHEAFHGIWMAGIASYTQMRSTQSTVAQLGHSILNNCQMVLQSCHDHWDVSPWAMRIFEQLSKAASMEQAKPSNKDAEAPGFEWIDWDATTFDNGMTGAWQSNPMLSALFDFPTEFGNIGPPSEDHTGFDLG
jgi:hypothetical protein